MDLRGKQEKGHRGESCELYRKSLCTFASGRICIFSPRISVQSCAACQNVFLIFLASWEALESVLHADELNAIISRGGNLAGSLARFGEVLATSGYRETVKTITHVLQQSTDVGNPSNMVCCRPKDNPRPCCNKGSRECSGDISRTKAPGQGSSTSHLSTMRHPVVLNL